MGSLKKKKPKDKVKERHKLPASKASSSPVISRPIAALAASKLDSGNAHDLSGGVKISSSPLRLRRLEWSRKERLQRSCSLDALDDIDIIEAEGEEVASPQTPGIEIRRCSSEASEKVIFF